ncbi:GAF domain-containing protein [Thermodesulfobacteriota bacterium]
MKYKIKNSVIPLNIIKRWQTIVDNISELLSVPSVMINRLDPPDLEVFRASSNPVNPMLAGIRMPISAAYCRKTIEKQEHVVFTDARKDPVMAETMAVKEGYLAYMGYPLFWPDGDIFGTLCIVDDKVNEWKNMQDKVLSAFRGMVETHLDLVFTIEQLNEKNAQLQQALGEVKSLKGLLPICAKCKKIRDDKGYWTQIESYIKKHSEADFSHGMCPECEDELYRDLDLIK